MNSLGELTQAELLRLARIEVELKKSFGPKPRLLILHAEHTPLYYYVSDIAALEKASLTILEMQSQAGEYDSIEEWAQEEAPIRPDTPRDHKFADPRMQAALQRTWESYDDNAREHKRCVRFVRLFEIALKDKAGILAYTLLKDRGDVYRYERISLEKFEEVPT